MARQLSRAKRAGLAAVRLEHVGVRLGSRWVLRDVDLEVRAGERWLLTGPNGAGKTVLLKLLAGEWWPTHTGVERRLYLLDGEWHPQPLLARDRVAYLGPERQDRYDRRELDADVADVVATGFTGEDLLLEPPSAAERRAARAALSAVGLSGFEARRFLTLSGGQRRRVLLARALVRRPDLLLLDEALNGLDAGTRRAFLRVLRTVAGERMAWVMSTHRSSERPLDVTHVAQISHGRVRTRTVRGVTFAPTLARARSGATRVKPATEPDAIAAPVRSAPLLALERVTVYRGGRRIIGPLDWQVRDGEHWRIAGPNGSGKSTLIALLYGDLAPAAGGQLSRRGLAVGEPVEDWKHRVGLVSPELQSLYAATACTLEEIVVSGLHSSIGLNESPSPADRARARRWLARMGLRGLGARRAREVSYGQLRRALVARALLRPRQVLLLDEPFDGLDADTRHCVRDQVRSAVLHGAQVVIATHHDEDVPVWVTHRLDLPARAGLKARVRAVGA